MGHFVSATEMADFGGTVLDCRFSLMDARAGRAAYDEGHIPGAHHLDLDEDMCGAKGEHGGRHPLPSTGKFARRLAQLGIDRSTDVICYDDSSYAFAARCWWMMRALGYRPPKLLGGGYAAWLALGHPQQQEPPGTSARPVPEVPAEWPLTCDREGLRRLQGEGAQLVDAREAMRYRGEQEPIDPVAGHIPGAANLPWQGMVADDGMFLDARALREQWEPLLACDTLVLYCGSGVSACVDLLALDMLGRDDAWLYAGSWSDWCSYL